VAYSTVILAEAALSSYWRLGEASGNAADSKGTNTGTYVGGATLGQSGALLADSNTAVLFDGVDDRVELPSLTIGALANASVELWFKSTQAGVDRWMWGEGSSTSNSPLFGLILQSGKVRSYWRENTGATAAEILSPSSSYNDGIWHHAVVTKSGSNFVLYVDGAQVGTATAAGTITLNRSTIGALRRSTLGSLYNGTIDEVAVYTAALSAASVLVHFKAGRYYVDSVTSGPTLSGTNVESKVNTDTAVSQAPLGGTRTESSSHSSTVTGGPQVAGGAAQALSHASSTSGSVPLAGSAGDAHTRTDSVVGSLSFNGSAVDSKSIADAVTGAISLVGGSTDQRVYAESVTGLLQVSGAAAEARFYADALVGTLILAGENTDAHARAASLAGSLVASGSIDELQRFSDIVSGLLTASGSATEAKLYADAVSHGLALAGSLSEAGQHQSAVVAVLTVAGTLAESLILPPVDMIEFSTAVSGADSGSSASMTEGSGSTSGVTGAGGSVTIEGG
jgi:hypothetical protein